MKRLAHAADRSSGCIKHLHSVYPHQPGYLIACPACEWHCHCDHAAVDRGESVPCVYLGHEYNESGPGEDRGAAAL